VTKINIYEQRQGLRNNSREMFAIRLKLFHLNNNVACVSTFTFGWHAIVYPR